MPAVKIVDIATASPPLRVSQEQILAWISQSPDRSEREKRLYRTILGEPSIATRCIAIDDDIQSLFSESVDQAAARFEQQASRLGALAVERLLKAAGLRAHEIDALVVTTCTGFLCPGLTSYIAQAVGLRETVHAVDLVGLGCGAALPALRTAWQYLEIHPDANSVVLAVEICSAAVSFRDDPESVLTNAIFGDGAAACLLTSRQATPGLVLQDYASVLWPQHRDSLRYVTNNGRLLNVIKRDVPPLAAKAFQRVRQTLTRDFSISLDHCAVHPGGRRVLDEIEAVSADGPPLPTLRRAREILRHFGNMSSPSVLYVLESMLRAGVVQSAERIGIFAFGAGLSAYGILAQRS